MSRSPPFGAPFFFQVDKLPRNVACRYFRPPFWPLSAALVCSSFLIRLLLLLFRLVDGGAASAFHRYGPPQAKVTVASLNSRRPYIPPLLHVDDDPSVELFFISGQVPPVGLGVWLSCLDPIVGCCCCLSTSSPPGGTRCFFVPWAADRTDECATQQETAPTPSFFP